jgi:3-hydroxyisobutyrate dehydrogenase
MTERATHGTTLPTIAVFGVGRMGSPIARNLLAAGFPVVVWNRAPERVAPVVDAGAKAAESPALAAAAADVMLTMLADGNAIADALHGPSGILAAVGAGTIWIQMATIGIEWTERFGQIADEYGLEFVDAPVSGSDGPAQAGELIVLASGPPQLHSRLQPIFDAIGRTTLRLGPAGNGTRLKIALNNWLAAQVEGVAETIALTEAMGLDPRLFLDAIAAAPIGSQYAVAKGRAMVAGEFEPGFTLRLAFKDVGLALDAARQQGVELPMTDAIARRWRKAMPEHADDDVDSVITVAVRAPRSPAAPEQRSARHSTDPEMAPQKRP